jgi:hypothetical protein
MTPKGLAEEKPAAPKDCPGGQLSLEELLGKS